MNGSQVKGAEWEIRVKTDTGISTMTHRATSPAELESAVQQLIQDIAWQYREGAFRPATAQHMHAEAPWCERVLPSLHLRCYRVSSAPTTRRLHS